MDQGAWASEVIRRVGKWPHDPITMVPNQFMRPFYRLGQERRSWGDTLFYLLGGLGTTLIWSWLGLAICRVAVIHFGRGERLRVSTALRFSAERFIDQVLAYVMPLGGILLMTLPLFVLGVLMRWSPMVALAGLVWILVLPVGFVMAVMAMGWFAGWPLLWGAVSSEGGDSFDAVSRSYSYTMQQPVRYLAYIAIAAMGGVVGWAIVWCLSEMVIFMAEWGISLGTGPARSQEIHKAIYQDGSGLVLVDFGGRLFRFWQSIVRVIASGYAASYFWCATSGVYLLMRYNVDATEFDEIYTGKYGAAIFDLQADEE